MIVTLIAKRLRTTLKILNSSQDLTKKDVVHASRWVVTNPFTILAKLLDNTKSLRIPQMVHLF